MALELRVNGVRYQRFKQVDGTRSRDTFCSEIRITTSPPQNNNSVLKQGDLVEIFRDDIKDFTGYLEKITDSEDRKSHDVSWRARSIICDLIDSTCPDNVKSLEGISKFSQLVQLCIDGLGLSDSIKVIDEVGAEFPDKEKIKAAGADDNCGDFLNENARIVNVFLNDDGDGNVVIRQNRGKLKTTIQNIPGALNNNVKSSTFDIDYSKRFHRYTVYSNSSLASEGSTTEDLNNDGVAFDNEIRPTRIWSKVAEKPMTSAQCKTAAEEEANIRRARSFAYSCEIAGFSANGELWEQGLEVSVKDQEKGISGLFLVNSVTWTWGNGGETVKINITLPDKNTVQANPAPITERISKPSGAYIVQSGDTLSQIADNYGVSLDSLVSANPDIENPNLIFPDQQIRIPTSGGSDTNTVRIARETASKQGIIG